MLAISRAQFAALSDESRRTFETRVIAHWRRCYPARLAKLDVEGRQALVAHAIERAKAHGLSVERDVCDFADLTLLFGDRFDHPKSGAPWARAILADESRDPPARLRALWDEARRRPGDLA